MFFGEKEINEDLICQHCKQRYDIPLMLPCGETVCKRCIDQQLDDDLGRTTGFLLSQCLICDGEHAIPKSGFPIVKPLMSLLNKKAKEVFRSGLVKEFKQHLQSLSNKRNEILIKLENKASLVQDYFEVKRQQIYLITESKHKEIDNRSRELLNEIDKLEQECLDQMKEDEQKVKDLSEKTDESNALFVEWQEKLSDVHLDEAKVTEANQKAKTLNAHLDRLNHETDCYLFNSRLVTFKENETEITADILGNIIKRNMRSLSKNDLIEIKKTDFINHAVIGVCLLDDGNLFIAYQQCNPRQNSSHYICFQYYDSQGTLILNKSSAAAYYNDYMSAFTANSNKNRVFFSFNYTYSWTNQYYLFVDNQTNIENIEHKAFSLSSPLFSVDDDSIYIFSLESQTVQLYDWNLNLVRSIQIDLQPATNYSPHVYAQNIFIINIGELCILNKDDGELIKKIVIDTTSTRFFFTNDCLISIKNNKINHLDLKLHNELTRELDLQGLTMDVVDFNKTNEKVAFYNHATTAIYIEK